MEQIKTIIYRGRPCGVRVKYENGAYYDIEFGLLNKLGVHYGHILHLPRLEAYDFDGMLMTMDEYNGDISVIGLDESSDFIKDIALKLIGEGV